MDLNSYRSKKATLMNSEVICALVGLMIIFGSIVVAVEISKPIEAARHQRYLACLDTGKKPINCSFEAAFGVIK